MDCIDCKSKNCMKPNSDKLFEDCTIEKNKEILSNSIKKYKIENIKNIYKTAAILYTSYYKKIL